MYRLSCRSRIDHKTLSDDPSPMWGRNGDQAMGQRKYLQRYFACRENRHGTYSQKFLNFLSLKRFGSTS